MSDETERENLTEAECAVREAIELGEVPSVDYSLPIVLAEYDRRGTERDEALKVRDRALMVHAEGYREREALRAERDEALGLLREPVDEPVAGMLFGSLGDVVDRARALVERTSQGGET